MLNYDIAGTQHLVPRLLLVLVGFAARGAWFGACAWLGARFVICYAIPDEGGNPNTNRYVYAAERNPITEFNLGKTIYIYHLYNLFQTYIAMKQLYA